MNVMKCVITAIITESNKKSHDAEAIPIPKNVNNMPSDNGFLE